MTDAEIAQQLRKLLNAYPLATKDWPLDVMREAADALSRRAASPVQAELLAAFKAVMEALRIHAPGTPLNNKENFDAIGSRAYKAIAKAERAAALSTPSASTRAEIVEAAVAALEEAEAILGGEYGNHYAVLCERMAGLRKALSPSALSGDSSRIEGLDR